MLNPINHSPTDSAVQLYKTEPYSVAGDVYGPPVPSGARGWTAYTWAAGWMYRAGLEGVLGLTRLGAYFTVNPCIPSSWPGFIIE